MNTQQVKRAGTLYTAGGAIWFLTIVGSQLVGFPWSEPHTTPFSIGLYPFVFMFPFVAVTGSTLDIAIAVLRYCLFDIDVLINRTLVYGGLTGITIGIYVLLVGGVGSLLQAQGSTAIAFVATGVVAVLFQPLRVRLQTAVNHLMYGQRDDPVGLLTHLAQQLEMVDSPERILPTLVETIATALKLPHVSLWLPEQQVTGTSEVPVTSWDPVAVYGKQTGDLLMMPLLHQNREVARLFVAPRGPGERLLFTR